MGGNGGNQGGFVPLFSSAYVHKIHERVYFGLGAFTISGASLDPNNSWAGRNDLTELNLLTFTLLPTLGVRVTDWLSVGGSVKWHRFDAALDDLGNPLGFSSEGKGWGFDASALLAPLPDVKIGVVAQDITGTDITYDNGLAQPLYPFGVLRITLSGIQVLSTFIHFRSMLFIKFG